MQSGAANNLEMTNRVFAAALDHVLLEIEALAIENNRRTLNDDTIRFLERHNEENGYSDNGNMD